MELASLLFDTSSNGTFSCRDGYDNVSDQDLVALYRLTHKALISLETEVEKRSVIVGTDAAKAIKKIRDNFRMIKVTKRVEDTARPLVQNAIGAVTGPAFTNPGSRRYQLFFIDILRLRKRGVFVLCAASLGKEKVRNMKMDERVEFLDFLEKNISTFESDVLDNLATVFGVPDYDCTPLPIDNNRPNKRKRRPSQGWLFYVVEYNKLNIDFDIGQDLNPVNQQQCRDAIEGGENSEVSVETTQLMRHRRERL
ncbi:hypothetical protein BO78DRAFT_194054 [Aspergillus sclerotiicarbonarius CBS 121057]|uniref:Uncharacterized protein n=1 Tax=Aspergillus sclerotiicarbonarius (strain CBS 121057 / IBT 28362) TaxID=1448318 RepID=A0A319EIP1_ASPSB|nr:hypothetical protein BO78DRAFT_194054 [Aspergillus sclerotiicarbonarius CBS 121057]